jgi:hypothetical protein
MKRRETYAPAFSDFLVGSLLAATGRKINNDTVVNPLSGREVLLGLIVALFLMLAILWMPATLGVLKGALGLPTKKLSLLTCFRRVSRLLFRHICL